MDQKSHWEKIYQSKSHTEVSWFAEHVVTSLELIGKTGLPKSASIVDVGGGASTLVDDLWSDGYRDITVIDLSKTALEIAQKRLGQAAQSVRWLDADILKTDFQGRAFDLWHDRAVFHFLTEDPLRQAYKAQLIRHVSPTGYVVMSLFAEDGPEKCSGLVVQRQSGEDLVRFFGAGFEKVFESKTIHVTPSQVEQRFLNIVFKRVAELA